MKTIELEDLEITDKDTEIILSCKVSDLRKKGYRGPVFIDTNRLYELHKESAQIVTKLALYRMMMS